MLLLSRRLPTPALTVTPVTFIALDTKKERKKEKSQAKLLKQFENKYIVFAMRLTRPQLGLSSVCAVHLSSHQFPENEWGESASTLSLHN